jgi:uncharacterized membrane protein YphA (DoxX/SURF4 family)
MKNWKTAILWTATFLLSALFLAAGVAKFGSAEAVEWFARRGYPAWFAGLIGTAEISAGILLLWPRVAWRAAAVLVLVMVGAVATQLYAGEIVQAILPATLLGALVVVGYCRHPRATLKARLQAAIDWVAERELAREEYRCRTSRPGAPGSWPPPTRHRRLPAAG